MERADRGRTANYISTRTTLGFVGLVTLSSALMAVASGGATSEIALVSGIGLIVAVLVVLVIGGVPWSTD